jgi:hypothetical protein
MIERCHAEEQSDENLFFETRQRARSRSFAGAQDDMPEHAAEIRIGYEDNMNLQKLIVKFFVEQPNAIPLTDFIDVFHGWIQATDGAYHDVADYSHMSAGPGIVLIANDANLSIDETDNRRGLLYARKGWLEGPNQEKLRTVLRAALANCRKLEDEPSLRGRLRFAMEEVAVSVNDRALAVNSLDAFEELKAELAPVACEFFGNAEFVFSRRDDPRQRLNVLVTSSAPFDSRAVTR